MAIHKGVKLTVVSQLEFQVHPEFAHPESSQFTNRSPNLRRSPKLERVESSPTPSSPSESKADRLLGRTSAVSVYIPSVPGAKFWLRYSIDEEAASLSEWYFFKLSMNGRHVASWGIHSKKQRSGQVMRALFEPTDKWNYKHEGTTFKSMGLETRPFFFAKDREQRTAASDGGLIEVLVYRALGRKRILPEPVDWKSQEEYGIVTPSTGLFENPQDAKYFDWLLVDPKESPYGTFRFHYRSWDSLESLHMIPWNYPRKLLPPSASVLSLKGLSRELQAQLEESCSEEETADEECILESPAKSSIMSRTSDNPWLTNVFDDVPDDAACKDTHKDGSIVSSGVLPLYPLRTQSLLRDHPAAQVGEEILSSESPWKDYLDRPLPQIPIRGSSLRHSRERSRRSSAASNAPSITASLLTYLDRDTVSPEPEFGVASAVAVTHAHPIIDDYYSGSDDDTPIQYENFIEKICDRRSGQHNNNLLRALPIPVRGLTPPPLFSTSSFSSITFRKPRNSPPKIPKRAKAKAVIYNSPITKVFSASRSNTHPDPAPELEPPTILIDTPARTLLALSEGQWMSRTPSPVKDHSALMLQRHGQENFSPIKERPSMAKRTSIPGLALTRSIDSDSSGFLPKSLSDSLSSFRGKHNVSLSDGNVRGNLNSKGSLRKKAMNWYERVKGGHDDKKIKADHHRDGAGSGGSGACSSLRDDDVALYRGASTRRTRPGGIFLVDDDDLVSEKHGVDYFNRDVEDGRSGRLGMHRMGMERDQIGRGNWI